MKIYKKTVRLDMRTTEKVLEKITAMMEKHDKDRPEIVTAAIEEKFDREFPKGLPRKKNGV